MIVRLRVLPDGSVASAAIRTATTTNPDLDAEVVKAVSAWKFPAFTGSQVEVDYPVIFANDGSQQASIEADLSGKLAALSPTEAPEYASAAEASAEGAPSPGAATTPEAPTDVSVPVVPSVPPPAVASAGAPSGSVLPPPRRRVRHREMAALPKPTPALLDRVQDALRSSRKLGRVRAYTNHGTVVLFGKVYNDNDKALADRVARGVPGVTGVNNTLTTDLAEWSDTAARITAQLQSAGLSKVTVRVIGRDAYLNGEVKTALERERAATVAEGAAAVTVKANMIRVVPGGIFSF
jgi:TonB family protein